MYDIIKTKKNCPWRIRAFLVGSIVFGLVGYILGSYNASSVPEIAVKHVCSDQAKAEIIQNRLMIALEGGLANIQNPKVRP